jgi:hypothetical protein
MGRQTRPVYVCDFCQEETLDPRNVRKIIGNISDGEGTHYFISDNIITTSDQKSSAITVETPNIEISVGKHQICSKMYCIKCIPIVLKLSESESERKTVELFKEQIESTPENLLETSRKEYQVVEEEHQEEPSTVKESFQESKQQLDEILDEFKDDEVQIEKKEVDTTQIIKKIKSNGKYHVLGKIKDSESEELVAKFYKFNNVDSMRNAYGGSLIGVYASTGKFVDNAPQNCLYTMISFLANVIMGIPHVTELPCFTDDTLAYAERDVINKLINEHLYLED